MLLGQQNEGEDDVYGDLVALTSTRRTADAHGRPLPHTPVIDTPVLLVNYFSAPFSLYTPIALHSKCVLSL